MYFTAHRCKTEGTAKGVRQSHSPIKPGAVTCGKTLDIKGVQLFHSGFKLFITGKAEVGASDDGMDWSVWQLLPDMVQDIDEPRMGTAQEKNKALGAVDDQGLVINERILEKFICTICPHQSGIRFFVRADAGDFSAQIDPITNFCKLFVENEACSKGFETALLLSDANVSHRSFVPVAAPAKALLMDTDINWSGEGQNQRESGAVVIMAMAEDDCVDGAEIKLEDFTVVDYSKSLAGVKEEAGC